jgi:hypothetical protein
MEFVWRHYPQYSGQPHSILDWLVGEARRIACVEHSAKQLEEESENSALYVEMPVQVLKKLTSVENLEEQVSEKETLVDRLNYQIYHIPLHDIKEQKLATKDLKQAKMDLEQATKHLDAFKKVKDCEKALKER